MKDCEADQEIVNKQKDLLKHVHCCGKKIPYIVSRIFAHFPEMFSFSAPRQMLKATALYAPAGIRLPFYARLMIIGPFSLKSRP